MSFMSTLFGRGPGSVGFTPIGYDINPSSFRTGEIGGNIYNTLMGKMRQDDTSAAELQMRKGLERAGKSAAAVSAGMTGIGAGTAQRLGAYSAGDVASQMASQLQSLRAQEQLAAEQQMQQYLSQQMQARIREEQLRSQQQDYLNRLIMEKDLYNASISGSGGFLNPLLKTGAQVGGFLLGAG